jgi:hypothetical protein
MILLCVSAIVASFGVYLPSPHDAHGWGLRVHNLSGPGPYLVGEWASRPRCDVTLINFSKETREHDPLVVARVAGDLKLAIIQPDGKELPGTGHPGVRNSFTQPRRLRSGEFHSFDFSFKEFGYGLTPFSQVGRYRVEASMKIDGKTVKAPPVEFEVVAIPPSAVLVSHAVALEGREANRPMKERSRPVIQQVPVGNRTLLIYRGPYGPARLAELPGKCEMTVEGAYGAGNPLTVTYKTAPDAKPTKLVINSISGSPWTEEEERLRQERLREKNGLPLLSPPRPIKP